MTRRPFVLAILVAAVCSTSLGQGDGLQLPKGAAWQSIPEIKARFLVPKDWHFTKDFKEPLTYFITLEDYAKTKRYDSGLKVSVRKIPGDQPVKEIAEKAIRSKCQAGELVQPVVAESFGTMTISGCIVRVDASGTPFTVAMTEVAGPKTNTLYTMSFQSPTTTWDRVWEEGKYVIGHFVLDDDF